MRKIFFLFFALACVLLPSLTLAADTKIVLEKEYKVAIRKENRMFSRALSNTTTNLKYTDLMYNEYGVYLIKGKWYKLMTVFLSGYCSYDGKTATAYLHDAYYVSSNFVNVNTWENGTQPFTPALGASYYARGNATIFMPFLQVNLVGIPFNFFVRCSERGVITKLQY